MYALLVSYVHMAVRRTTIELDEELLAEAKNALGQPTTRATVELALRRAIAGSEIVAGERAARQRQYLQSLSEHIDLEVLSSDDMWR